MRNTGRLRVALVGLGKIAQKAYLPVIATRADVDLAFCTRSEGTLQRLSQMYRVGDTASSLQELLARPPDAAFVHTATESHPDIVAALLQAGVHVYVDKPIAYDLESSQALADIARGEKRILMVGFNRRFAPMYRRLFDLQDRRLIVMQKNRVGLADVARRVVFDDFIHVVDTLRHLLPGEPTSIRVSADIEDGSLNHVLLQLESGNATAIGIMNRDSGTTEETLEVMGPGQKRVVRDLNETLEYRQGVKTTSTFADWDSVLMRRGFPQIVDHFLEHVASGAATVPSIDDSVETHALCERIVEEIEAAGASRWTPAA